MEVRAAMLTASPGTLLILRGPNVHSSEATGGSRGAGGLWKQGLMRESASRNKTEAANHVLVTSWWLWAWIRHSRAGTATRCQALPGHKAHTRCDDIWATQKHWGGGQDGSVSSSPLTRPARSPREKGGKQRAGQPSWGLCLCWKTPIPLLLQPALSSGCTAGCCSPQSLPRQVPPSCSSLWDCNKLI